MKKRKRKASQATDIPNGLHRTATAQERRFAKGLMVRSESVENGEELTPGATHDVEEDDEEYLIRRRRFSAA